MPMVKSNGADIWYELTGKDSETIAGIGGIGLVSNQFDLVTPLLSEHMQVLNWDLRGVGKSKPIPKVNYGDYADQAIDLLAVMDAAGIEKAHIWGCACAHIGVRFAAEYPDRTASLILFPWYSPKKTIEQVFGAGAELSLAFDSLDFWSKIIVERFSSPNMSPELAEWESSKLCENLPPEVFRALWAGMRESDCTKDLPKISCPSLLLMGNVGVAGNNANQHAINQVQSGVAGSSEVALIEGTGGTFYMLEKPQETVEILVDWVSRHPAG